MLQKLSEVLEHKSEIVFAYVFGSFILGKSFNDIDIGLYVSGDIQESALKTELDLEKELEKLIQMPY